MVDKRIKRYARPLTLLALGICTGLLAATAFYVLHQPAAVHTAAVTNRPTSAIPGPPDLPASDAKHIQPVTLTIPAIGLTTNLVDLALNADRTLQPPVDYQTAGWFAAGPAPGDAGPPAIIAGHVDSQSGPAIFARLHELAEGSDIQVTGIDSVVRHFTVYRSADYPKSGFPADEVYATTAKAELRLITCTGDFDQNAGSYVSNLVVYATLAP